MDGLLFIADITIEQSQEELFIFLYRRKVKSVLQAMCNKHKHNVMATPNDKSLLWSNLTNTRISLFFLFSPSSYWKIYYLSQ